MMIDPDTQPLRAAEGLAKVAAYVEERLDALQHWDGSSELERMLIAEVRTISYVIDREVQATAAAGEFGA